MDKPGGYPSFVVMDTNKRKNVLVTHSARKAVAALEKGRRIEIWYNGTMRTKSGTSQKSNGNTKKGMRGGGKNVEPRQLKISC